MIYLLFAIGLIFLIRGGDWFVDGASGIARKFHFPELLIGATIVSIGTTLPEVMVSANSAIEGHSQIAYGNAIGSVICNSALIAAISIAVRPSLVNRDALRMPVVFFFAAAVIFAGFAYIFGDFPRIAGIILLVIFAFYIYTSVRQMQWHARPGSPTRSEDEEVIDIPTARLIVLLVAGALLIAVGADMLVDNGVAIARNLGVDESVLGFTVVALGTSLPELITAVTSLIKGHSSLSLGNIIGANVLNLVLVCGIAITLAPFSLPADSFIAGYNTTLLVELPVMFLVMAVLTFYPLKKARLTRTQGITLLAIYISFSIFQFAIAR